MRRRIPCPWGIVIVMLLACLPASAAESAGIQPACQRMFDWLLAGEQVRFRQASEELGRSSYAFLERLAEFARDCPDVGITITGHTDNVGDPAFNLALSERRAAAVAGFLTARGVDAARLTVAGAGDKQPVADNRTAWGRERNRRIEFGLRPAG